MTMHFVTAPIEQVGTFYATQHQSSNLHACVAASQRHLKFMLSNVFFKTSTDDIDKMHNMRPNALVPVAGFAAGHESL
jgi:hypothetical protein